MADESEKLWPIAKTIRLASVVCANFCMHFLLDTIAGKAKRIILCALIRHQIVFHRLYAVFYHWQLLGGSLVVHGCTCLPPQDFPVSAQIQAQAAAPQLRQ